MAALQLVQPHSTQDERLDVLGKEAQEFEGKELMARYEKAKRFMWAKEEFGLEHGGDRQTEQSKLYKNNLKYTSFDHWCNSFGFQDSNALADIKVVELLGDRADLSQIKTAWTSLVPVAYAKDKEKKAEVLDRIFSGEKLTGVEVKEAIDGVRDVAERFLGYREPDEEALVEEQRKQVTRREANRLDKSQFRESVEAGIRITTEFKDWQKAVKVLVDQHGISLPPLSEEAIEHFVLYTLFGKN